MQTRHHLFSYYFSFPPWYLPSMHASICYYSTIFSLSLYTCIRVFIWMYMWIHIFIVKAGCTVYMAIYLVCIWSWNSQGNKRGRKWYKEKCSDLEPGGWVWSHERKVGHLPLSLPPTDMMGGLEEKQELKADLAKEQRLNPNIQLKLAHHGPAPMQRWPVMLIRR